MRITGIYSILNTVTGKIYIGQAVDFDKRVKNHVSKLRNNSHYNKAMQADCDKYGIKSFKFRVVRKVPILLLNKTEQSLIATYQTAGADLYNIVKTMGA